MESKIYREQKGLTSKQKEICMNLRSLFAEADKAGIKFVFDKYDSCLSAYNGDGVASVHSESVNSDSWNQFNWLNTIELCDADFVNSGSSAAIVIDVL